LLLYLINTIILILQGGLYQISGKRNVSTLSRRDSPEAINLFKYHAENNQQFAKNMIETSWTN